MRDNKRIKAVLFDLDDTLIDWSGATMKFGEFTTPKIANIAAYLKGNGYALATTLDLVEAIHNRTRFVWEEATTTGKGASLTRAIRLAFEDLGLPADEIDMDAVLHAYSWEPFPGVKPFHDTHEVLQTLKDRGYLIGLVTNAYQPMWMRDVELHKYDLMKYLDARITSGDTGFIKPHPAIYWRILGMLDLYPSDAVFVGDRPSQDIKGAHSVDMIGVLMAPPHLRRDPEGIKPDYTIRKLSELLPILDALD